MSVALGWKEHMAPRPKEKGRLSGAPARASSRGRGRGLQGRPPGDEEFLSLLHRKRTPEERGVGRDGSDSTTVPKGSACWPNLGLVRWPIPCL